MRILYMPPLERHKFTGEKGCLKKLLVSAIMHYLCFAKQIQIYGRFWIQ